MSRMKKIMTVIVISACIVLLACGKRITGRFFYPLKMADVIIMNGIKNVIRIQGKKARRKRTKLKRLSQIATPQETSLSQYNIEKLIVTVRIYIC